MSTHEKQLTWGAWLKSRSRFVGYTSTSAFALAVGCTPQHARLLMRMREPVGMRRRLDPAICRVLRVDRKTLFTDYVSVDPESAPLVDRASPPAAPGDDDLRAEIVAAAKRLSGDRLRALQVIGQVLVA